MSHASFRPHVARVDTPKRVNQIDTLRRLHSRVDMRYEGPP